MGLDSQIIPPSIPQPVPGEIRRACLKDFSWLAKLRPSGNVFSTYAYAVSGNLISFWFRVSADIAGSRVHGLFLPLPDELPRPDSFSAKMPSELFIGQGILSKSALITSCGWRKPARTALVSLRKNSLGAFDIYLVASPCAATHAWGVIHYYA